MEGGHILLRDKQAAIILLLKASQDVSISSIAKSTGTTYVHVSNFIAECEKLGITVSEKHGRLKSVRLSEKGIKIADMLSAISSYLSQQENQKPPG
ncbi:MAG: winged helix DNA-binding protein [Candidatus Micrarchaeaceae archaeon]